MTTVILTGGAGFLGSHALRHIMVNTDWNIILPVTMTHHGKTERIRSSLVGLEDGVLDRIFVGETDLRNRGHVAALISEINEVDYIINFASESHVDRSIEDPVPFIQNNVDVMLNVLEMARILEPKAVVQVSTDEVYGPAPWGVSHKEWDPHRPSNPYSASKSAQESICFAYWRTYGVPVIIVNSMNLVGEMQDTEKFVPKTIKHIIEGRRMPIHASPDGVIGSRHYMHARNLADAILYVLSLGEPSKYSDLIAVPDKWHIAGQHEVTNLEIAQMVAYALGKPLEYELVDFHSSRPGHDLRYSLDVSALTHAGWKAPMDFADALHKTVQWYRDNPSWLK